ncbi:MAG: hypothetical protein ACKOZN_00270 [Cyanobium sp.]
MPADLWIANTVSDLIQGDVREHLPLERIPLSGDVLGLGTTTSLDNGELTFLQQEGAASTTIWKCEASSGGIRALRPGDGSGHFPYVCFSGDATALRTPLSTAELAHLMTPAGQPLQELVGEAIARLRGEGRLAEAPIYGLRLLARWQSLVITVASKLCMGQQRRNTAIARSAASEATAAQSIYQLLQHYRLAAHDPGDPADPIRYLGASLQWECCGIYDTDPEQGRVTVPQRGAHLHLHCCSTDLRHGGHLHHEHPGSQLAELERLVLYPLQRIHSLASDLGVEELRFEAGAAQFRVVNRGALDVSDVGVAVVVDDRYSSHRYLRLPWLAAGDAETFTVPLELVPGRHRLEVIADPQLEILERPELQANNRLALEVEV